MNLVIIELIIAFNSNHIPQIFIHWQDMWTTLWSSSLHEHKCCFKGSMCTYYCTSYTWLPAHTYSHYGSPFLSICSSAIFCKEKQLCWRAKTTTHQIWQQQIYTCLYPNNPTSHGSLGWLSKTKHHYLNIVRWPWPGNLDASIHTSIFYVYTLYLASNPPCWGK